MARSIKRSVALFAGALMWIAVKPAVAWDGTVTGTITSIQIANATNQAFRVFLSGISTVCVNGASWGYLNEADSNYKTYVAGLLLAKAQGSTVTLYSMLENGYCHIGYVSIN